MKWRMCKGIAKNIGFLFSYDFFRLAFKDKDCAIRYDAPDTVYFTCRYFEDDTYTWLSR